MNKRMVRIMMIRLGNIIIVVVVVVVKRLSLLINIVVE